MSSPSAFQVRVTLPLAVYSAKAGLDLPDPVRSATYGSRLRSAVARMALGDDPELREVLELTCRGVVELERKVAHLEHQLALSRAGIELVPTEMLLGQDGMTVPDVPADPDVHVILLLTVRGIEHLLVTRGVHTPRAGGTTITFVDTEPAVRDLLVAFCFQQQGEERRRALRVAGR